jgi:transposase
VRSGSLVDAYELRIRGLLTAFPRMPATVIAERIGWPYSIRTLSGRVAELRPGYLPPDPASRTAYAAGEIAQCDFWFPDVELPVGFGQIRTARLLPVLTMVCSYSRFALAAALQIGAGSVCRLVAADQPAGRGAPSVGVGREGCGGPVASPPGRVDR